MLKRKKNREVDGRKKWSSSNGAEPFRRAALLTGFFFLSSAILGIAVMAEKSLVPPSTVVDSSRVMGWIITSVLLPHIPLYLFGILIAFYILPQSDLRYSWFLFKEGKVRILLTIMAVQAFMLIMFAAIMSSHDESGYRVNESGYSPVQMLLWNFSIISMAIPTWVGYRTGWIVYREAGAQTMQQRYEADLRNMEIRRNGQFWDKFVERPVKFFTGLDGHKPRGFILWSLISIAAYLTAMLMSTYLSSPYLFGMGVFSAIPAVTAFIAAISKHRDGMFSRSIPVLIPVRDADTEDDYNPRSTGAPTFDRS